jgi:hypothetical protein
VPSVPPAAVRVTELPLQTAVVEAVRVVGAEEGWCTVTARVAEPLGAAQAEVVTIFTQ